MQVCLINPYSDVLTYAIRTSSVISLGLGYIASTLEQGGHEVEIIECNLQKIGRTELADILKNTTCKIFGLSVFNNNFMSVTRIINDIRKYVPDASIFLGGYMATFEYGQILNNLKVDACVLGEGEKTFLNIINAIDQGSDWKIVGGIAYKNENSIVINPSHETINNLDELPFPKRVYYHDGPLGKSSSMITLRGCSYGKCIFCGTDEFYQTVPSKRYRLRSVGNVLIEIKNLIRDGVDFIYFQDDTFPISNKRWINEFMEGIEKSGMKFRFQIFSRAVDVIHNQKVYARLSEIGMEMVFLGIESFCDRQLKYYNKMTTAIDNINAINELKKMGIKYVLGMILLDPYVTIDELLLNLETITKLNVAENFHHEQYPLSGLSGLYGRPFTPFYQMLKDENILDTSQPLNYKFQNEGIDVYFEITQKWREYIDEFMVYIETILGKQDDLYNIVRKFHDIDIQFMLDLASRIQRKEDLTNYLELKKEELYAFYHSFMEACEIAGS